MLKTSAVINYWNDLNHNIKGFVFILMASATFPIMGTIIKYLTIELHPFQVAFFRCFFGFFVFFKNICFGCFQRYCLEIRSGSGQKSCRGLLRFIWAKFRPNLTGGDRTNKQKQFFKNLDLTSI